MCHSKVLKLQHALEIAKDRKIQALNQKLQQANAKVNGLEMKLLSTEKQAAVSFHLVLVFIMNT